MRLYLQICSFFNKKESEKKESEAFMYIDQFIVALVLFCGFTLFLGGQMFKLLYLIIWKPETYKKQELKYREGERKVYRKIDDLIDKGYEVWENLTYPRTAPAWARI